MATHGPVRTTSFGWLAGRSEPVGPHVLGSDSFREFVVSEVERLIPDRFAWQVAREGGRIAVKSRDAAFTYNSLNNAANVVAHAVIKETSDTHDVTAVLLDHGPAFVVGSLALLKAGKIQVPLEASFPDVRLQHVLRQSGAGAVVTDSRHLALARRLGISRIINLDDHDLAQPAPELRVDSDPGDAVAVVYTSGSTGLPKGVVWSHRAVLHAVMRHTNAYRVCLHDRVLALRASPRPYLYALLNGAAYYPISFHDERPEHLAEWMAQERITVYRSAVSAFRAFAQGLGIGHQFPDLRLILVFGEAVYRADVQLCGRRFGLNCVLAASLGCLEFDDYACAFLNARDPDRPLPGFQVMDGADVLVLDGGNRPVPAGDIGEIVLRSRHHPVGYWQRPDLTPNAFLRDPCDERASLYRTGDLGRFGADGRLFHAGRIDAQVKVRGHRVEPAEVEGAILELPGVKEVAVVGVAGPDDDTRLVAYLVSDGERAPAAVDLRRGLGEVLPDYMIPSSFVFLDALPLTATGKVDHRALRVAEAPSGGQETPFVAPRTDLERRVAAIWADILHVPQVGALDHFFALGGDSLAATRIISRVRAEFGVGLSLRAMLDAPTVADLSARLAAGRASGTAE